MIESIQAYGFRVPLLVSEESEIIDGDLRLKAAKKLGFSELPVIVCAGWSPEQIRAARLMFNRSATWAEWAPRGFAIPDFSDTSSKVPFPRFRYSRFVPPEKP